MAKLHISTIKFNGLDGVSATLRKITANVNGAANQIERRLNRVGKRFQTMGKGVTGGLGLPAIGGGLAAGEAFRQQIGGFMEFEDQLKKTQALLQANDKDMASLSERALSLSQTTTFKPTDIAKAQQEFARMGATLEQISGGMEPILKSAMAAGVDTDGLAQHADRLTNIAQGAFGSIDTAALSRAADIVTTMATGSAMTMSDAANNLKTAIPMAKALGLSLEEMAAWQMSIADDGFRGAEAAKAFRTGMLRVIAPTKKAQQALNSIGVDLQKYASGSSEVGAKNIKAATQSAGLSGLSDSSINAVAAALNDTSKEASTRLDNALRLIQDEMGSLGAEAESMVRDRLSGEMARATGFDFSAFMKDMRKLLDSGAITIAQMEKIFGKERFAPMLAALQSVNEFEDYTKDLEKSAGATERYNETASKSLARKLEQLQSAWASFNITLGAANSETFAKLVDGLTGLVNRMNDFAKANPNFAAGLNMLTGAAAIAVPALATLGFAVTGLAAGFKALALVFAPVRLLAKGIGLLLGPIGALGKVSAKSGGAIARMAKGAAAGFGRMLPMLGRMGPYGLAAAAAIGALYLAWEPLNNLSGGKFAEGLEKMKGAFSSLLQGDFSGAFDQFLDGMGKFRDGVVNILPDLGPVFEKFDKLAIAAGKFLDAILPGDGLKEGWDFIANSLGLVFDNILAVVEANISILTTSFEGLAKVIEGVFTLDAGKIADGFGTAFNGVKDAMSELMTTLAGNWGEFLGSIGLDLESVSEMGSAIKEKAASMVDSVVAGIADWGQGITNAVTGLVDYVVAGVASWASAIGSAVRGLINDALSWTGISLSDAPAAPQAPEIPTFPAPVNDNFQVPKVERRTPLIDVGGPGAQIREMAGDSSLTRSLDTLSSSSVDQGAKLDEQNAKIDQQTAEIQELKQYLSYLPAIATNTGAIPSAMANMGNRATPASPAPGSPRSANWSSSGLADPQL
ncbi:hypothetical protein ROS1_28590 [Roseibium sp. ROS1]